MHVTGAEIVHPYALERLAEDRAEQLRRLAAVRRVAADQPLLPSVRRAAGRLLVGIGERLLADARRPSSVL
jgi:hypothetical protein